MKNFASNHQESVGGRPVGVVAMAVTPFTASNEIDTSRLRGLVRDAADQRFDAVVIAGGAGEISSLSPEEVIDLTSSARQELGALGSSCRILVGLELTGDSPGVLASFREAGADGVLCFASDSGDADACLAELVEENAQGPRLAVLVDHDGRRFTLEGLRHASEVGDGIGVKYGSPDLRLWQTLRSELPHVHWWICGAGDDLAPAFVALGADGFTSTTFNIAPEFVREVAEMMSVNLHRAAADLVSSRLHLLAGLRSSRPSYVAAVTKAAMDRAGRAGGEVRNEGHRFDRSDSQALNLSVDRLLWGI